MLYSSEGLMSACGLVPSVFGCAGIVVGKRGKSRVFGKKRGGTFMDSSETADWPLTL